MSEDDIPWTEKDKMIIDQWILRLFALDDNKPIRGKTRITKELFIIAMEYDPEFKEAVYFYPYNFGPYSSRLAHRMNFLMRQGYFIREYKGREWAYKLNIGKIKDLGNLFRGIPFIEELIKLKRRFARMSSLKIITEIYNKYPEYAIRSAVGNEILYSKDFELKQNDIDDGPGIIYPLLGNNEDIPDSIEIHEIWNEK